MQQKTAPVCLTWSLPPHLPWPEFLRGLTSKLCHDRRELFSRFTWILSPIAGMDLPPQTQTKCCI